ncbi:flagellin lysine-N-methylase [Yersinia enterocolitica]|uniref:flagellin lysine-N-methylase n=1 Tax=Yersinia enterocolitica TaxID=630 RepID=UPI001CA5E47D|nr:flagellin lysine-N-methylase [Yersinia enterocolitica]MBW5833755.1 flagellin lysine-N-methylase [Yersinia enterocolitica]
MKELQIIQPQFVERFSCLGSACRDHCCNGWGISIDKDTYRKYKNSQNQNIRKIAIKNIDVHRTSEVNWASIRLDKDGNCPYLDEARLCEVHKCLGGDALSKTCSSYPRSSHQYKTEKFNTLTLSCPEVTRLVLFDPNAFTMHEETVKQQYGFNKKEIDTEGRMINFYCNQLVMISGDNIDENIYAVNLFIQCYQDIDKNAEDRVQIISTLYNAIGEKLTSGTIAQEIAAIPLNANSRWHFLMMFQRRTISTLQIRGQKTLFNYMAFLIHHLMNNVDVNQLEERMEMLSSTWKERVLPLLNQHPHILRNFFQYNFYHNQFALNKIETIDKDFYAYTIDFFIIKSVISAFVIYNNTLSEDDIINIIYSYSIFRIHNGSAQELLLSNVDKVNESDNITLLNILN